MRTIGILRGGRGALQIPNTRLYSLAEMPLSGPQTPFFSLLLYVRAKARNLHS
jgi:hypothetical protein